MGHKISKLLVNNYRSIINEEFILSDFTALIGYNNAGKSNCLSAIQWLLKRTSLSSSDFYDVSASVEVSATIEGLTEDILDHMPEAQKKSIEKYINDEKLIIRRAQNYPDQKSAEIKISVWSFSENDWVQNPTGIDNAIGVLLPDPIRIGAMENAAEDASKSKSTTTIGKLLSEFLKPVKDAHENMLNRYLTALNRRISSEGSRRIPELSSIDDELNGKISDLFPGIGVKLHFEAPNIDDLIKSGTIKVYEDDFAIGRDFSSYGHGAQRSIQMALVRYLAEYKKDRDGSSSTTLLLIDEPELYLHPFAVEQIREALLDLSKNGYQILISTHSAQMVTSSLAEKALLIRKDRHRGTYSRTRLLDAIQTVVPNSVHQMEQLFTLSHSSQLLFAEKVILTEGKTELRLLPFLFESISGKTFGQRKYALIAQTGVNDTRKSLDILKAMDIPAKAICDLDYCFKNAVRDGFLAEADSDLVALKSIISRLASMHGMDLSPDGLPKKNNKFKAYECYEILASDVSAIPYIEALFEKMKAQNIWIWRKGAIEAHLGIASKDESAWALFKSDIDSRGVHSACSDYSGLSELISWIEAG